MYTATALTTPLPTRAEQLALPLTDRTPLLPAPVEHGDVGILRHRAAVFMQAVAEVLTGQRAAHQIAGWFTPEVFWSLRRRLSHGRTMDHVDRRGLRAKLASVHVSMVNDDVAELCGRIVHGERSRAIAVRLERSADHRGEVRWCCTALTWA